LFFYFVREPEVVGVFDYCVAGRERIGVLFENINAVLVGQEFKDT